MHKIARGCLWVLLGCCAIIDGGLGEAAISGCCDVASVENGVWQLPGPMPELWLPIAAFVLFQGILIALLIRMKRGQSSNIPISPFSSR